MIQGIILTIVVGGMIWGLGWWLFIKTEGVYLGRRTVIQLYDWYASRYDGIKGYEPALESRYLARPILEQLEPNDAPMVLDVATGTARLPRALMKEDRFHGRVVGVDLSRRMLRYGAGRVAEWLYYERVYLMHAPAEKLPFPDNTFDLVTCLEALEFMVSPKAVVAELARVTRPNGWLLLTNRRGLDAQLMPFKVWSPEQAVYIYENELGLENVEFQSWQLDYDLVWAQKAGESLPTRARALEEIWCCPHCSQIMMQKQSEYLYLCSNCKTSVSVGRDGVIEL